MSTIATDLIVVIPSKGRAAMLFAYNQFAPHCERNGIPLYVVICEDELESYKKTVYEDHIITATPHHCRSIEAKRTWILRHFTDKIVLMVDDDVHLETYDGKANMLADDEYFDYFFNKIREFNNDGYYIGGVIPPYSINWVAKMRNTPRSEQEFKITELRTNSIWYVNTTIFQKLWDDVLIDMLATPSLEDFNLFLTFAMNGYRSRLVSHSRYRPMIKHHHRDKGGCAAEREETGNFANEQKMKFVQHFWEFSSLVNNGTSLKINLKAAYKRFIEKTKSQQLYE